MLSSKRLCAALALLAILAVSAEAAIIPSATKTRDFPTSPANFTSDTGLNTAAANQQWQGWVLSVSSDAGEVFTGVDIRVDGVLHQRWDFELDENEDVVAIPTPRATSTATGDSHVLRATSGTIAVLEDEDNNVNNGNPYALPLSDIDPGEEGGRDYGAGSFLEGIWAISSLPTSVNMAYIVIPEFADPNDPGAGPYNTLGGTNRALKIHVELAVLPAGADTPELVVFEECAFFAPCIPEPSTALLAGLAMFGFAGYVRRRK